jgi:hypothetical protein
MASFIGIFTGVEQNTGIDNSITLLFRLTSYKPKDNHLAPWGEIKIHLQCMTGLLVNSESQTYASDVNVKLS